MRMSSLRLKSILELSLKTNFCFLPIRSYAKKPSPLAKVGGQAVTKQKLEPVTDALLLSTRLCGANIYESGDDPVLKADAEYPEWLWKLRLTRSPPPIEELDTDSWEYWRRVHKMNRKRKSHEQALKYKFNRF